MENVKAQFEDAKYSMASSFEGYIYNLNQVKNNLENANTEVSIINAGILELEEELVVWNELAQVFA